MLHVASVCAELSLYALKLWLPNLQEVWKVDRTMRGRKDSNTFS